MKTLSEGWPREVTANTEAGECVKSALGSIKEVITRIEPQSSRLSGGVGPKEKFLWLASQRLRLSRYNQKSATKKTAKFCLNRKFASLVYLCPQFRPRKFVPG